jgi:hypothetical protein
MRTITNNYADSQILNLGKGSDHGPYLVTQTGVAPTDHRAKTRLFVLRPDGRWADFNAYVCQGKPEAMDEIVFPSVFKLMATLGRLMGRPQVVDLPIDEAGLKVWIERQRNGDPLEAARAWASQYKVRHRSAA